jgi:large subunit ribosomal protein L32
MFVEVIILAKTPIISYYLEYMVNHMRHTSGHTGNRRSHHALTAVDATLCKDCGALKQKHRACSSCGKYKGIDVFAKKVKAPKKTKKEKKAATKSKPKAAKVKKVTAKK